MRILVLFFCFSVANVCAVSAHNITINEFATSPTDTETMPSFQADDEVFFTVYGVNCGDKITLITHKYGEEPNDNNVQYMAQYTAEATMQDVKYVIRDDIDTGVYELNIRANGNELYTLYYFVETEQSNITISDLCIRDSFQDKVQDVRVPVSGEICFVRGSIKNDSTSKKNVNVFVAFYDSNNLELIDLKKETYSISASSVFNLNMPFEWSMDCEGQETVCVFVFDGRLRPICGKYTIGVEENINMYITDNVVYQENFEEGLPEKFSDAAFELYESNGNHLLQIDGSGKIVQSQKLLEKEDNIAITADFFQDGSTGATISAVGFGRYDLKGKQSQRFVYCDVKNQNRDIFGYGVSEASSAADNYSYEAFSNKTGLLDQSTRRTNPFSMTMAYCEGKIFCRAENVDNSVIWDYASEVATDKFIYDGMRDTTNGFVLMSHSANVYVDNIIARKIVKSDKIVIDLPEVMLVGKWYKLNVKAIAKDGKEYSLPFENLTFKCDSDDVEFAYGKIRVLNQGTQRIRVICNDSITGGKGTATINLRIVSKIDGLEFENLKDLYTIGEEIVFDVNAYVGSERIGIKTYVATCDGIVINDSRIAGLSAGTHTIEVVYDDSLSVCKTIDISGGVQINPGMSIREDFENHNNETAYFNYDKNDVVSYGSSKVLALKNKITDLQMPKGLANYTLSGKFKIIADSIDNEAYTAGFEVVTRRTTNEMFGATARGVHFIYELSRDGEANMRIGTALSQKKLSENEEWHNFSVTMYKKVCVFNIDGHEMTTSVSTTMTAGFYLLANNCKVLVDDIELYLTPTGDGTIEPCVFCDTINPYEIYPLASVVALRKGKNNIFVSPDAITWKTAENSGIEVVSNNLLFDDTVQAGEHIITAVYGGREYPITINVEYPSMTKEQYVRETVGQRQKSLAFRLSERCDELGVDFSKDQLSYLPAVFAKMLLYPKLTDYSDALVWHVNEAQYQDTIVGRGNDGGDFVMLQLIMAYKELYGKLNANDDAWEFVKEYLTSVNYAKENAGHTENHMLVHYATALLVSETWPNSTVSGNDASNTHDRYKQYLINWYNKHLERGFGEYNSAHYYFVDTFALEILYTYTNDTDIKQICFNLLNYIYADGLNGSINDNFGGAALRTYTYKDLTTRFDGFKRMFNLGKYVIDDQYNFANIQISQSFTSAFRPLDILYSQALETQKCYEILETSETYHLPYEIDWDSFVTRYTYVTPDYVLGSKIGYIPPSGGFSVSSLNGHQEMPWSLQLGSKSSRLIFGGLNSANAETSSVYWVTSRGEDRYRLMQNGNLLVGIYELKDNNSFVHYRIPKYEFEVIDEEEGWIFTKDENVYIAFKPVADTEGDVYTWSSSGEISGQIALRDSEIKINKQYSGFILEVMDKTEYLGTYEQFKQDIINNANVEYAFDNSECRISYTDINGSQSVGLDYYNDVRYKNGEVFTADNSKLHSSPYLNSSVNEGTVTMLYDDEEYTISTIK